MSIIIDGTANDITGLTEPLAVGAATASGDAITKSAAEGQMLGVGQTWQVVTGSRAAATNYTNSTGKPIVVQVGAYGTLSSNLTLTIGGVQAVFCATGTDILVRSVQGIVPSGAVYSVSLVGGNATIQNWTELR